MGFWFFGHHFFGDHLEPKTFLKSLLNRWRREWDKLACVFSARRWVILVARTRWKKIEGNSVHILAKFACGQVSSPRLCRLTYLTRFWLTEVGRRLRSIPRNIPVLEAKKVKALRYFSKNLKNLDGYLEETSLMFSNKYS